MEIIEFFIKSTPLKIIGGLSPLIPLLFLLLHFTGLNELSTNELVIVVGVAILGSIGLMRVKSRTRTKEIDPVCQNCKNKLMYTKVGKCSCCGSETKFPDKDEWFFL